MSPPFDDALALRWQDLMSRWAAANSEVSELSHKLEHEDNPQAQARIRRDLDLLQAGLVDLRGEIDTLIKHGARSRDQKGDKFVVATMLPDALETVPDVRHRQR